VRIAEFFELLNFRDHKIQDTTLLVGGTAAAAGDKMAPSLPAGDWLATHGVGVLTWIEIIQVIGALGVVVTILNIAFRAIMTARKG